MKTFKKRWDGHGVDDYGGYMSPEAKSFCNCFRNMLKRELSPAGINIVGFNTGHYYCSTFLEKDGKYIYVSYTLPRMSAPITFSDSGVMRGVLYRKARHSRDTTGGSNHFCSIEMLPSSVVMLFHQMEENN